MTTFLYTNGLSVSRTIAEFAAFDFVRHSPSSRLGVTLNLANPGVIDLSAQLGIISANVSAHRLGNWIITGSGNDNLFGGTGNDILDGGRGVDTMRGGLGNDSYLVNSIDDTVVELFKQGYDIITLTGITPSGLIDYRMPDNVEELVIGGAKSLQVMGNDGDNVIRGNGVASLLLGEGGNDTLYAMGNGYLMNGGEGDDTYVLGNFTALLVAESSNNGFDTLTVSRSYINGDVDLERIILTGTLAIDLTGSQADEILIGNSARNTISGGGGDNSIDGGGNVDTVLYGFRYIPGSISHSGTVTTVVAGFGTDTLTNVELIRFHNGVYNVLAQSFLSDNVGLTLTGNASDNVFSTIANVAGFRTGALDDTISGLNGNDTIDGGGGSDTMIGGLGDDIYFADIGLGRDSFGSIPGDTIVELENAGNDIVFASGDFTLHHHVERLTLTGTAISGTGNALANQITGNAGDNILSGMDGDDVLDGATGADRMVGGAGDDTYYFDNDGDRAVEVADGGNDRMLSSTTHTTVGNHIETLEMLSGALVAVASASGTIILGNGSSNTLVGGEGSDQFFGGDGNDRFIGFAGHDVMTGDAGDDTFDDSSEIDYVYNPAFNGFIVLVNTARGIGNDQFFGGDGNDTLLAGSGNDFFDGGDGVDTIVFAAGMGSYRIDRIGGTVSVNGITINESQGDGVDTFVNVETLRFANGSISVISGFHSYLADGLVLTGTDANDSLVGTTDGFYVTDKDDRLDGGLGADRMQGNDGFDTYIVDNIGDRVIELANRGIDTVQSSISYTLPRNVEVVLLTGTGAINATGNDDPNELYGNGSANVLTGLAGADVLFGSGGDDVLFGGAGDDRIDGSTGFDTVVYAGRFADYKVDSALRTVTSTAEGADTLRGVERVTFLDGVLDWVSGIYSFTTTGPAVIGTARGDFMVGSNESNHIDGQAGADAMEGRLGNDTYVVDNAGDRVFELADAGTDTVLTTLSWTLAANVENLVLSGGGAVTGRGNAHDNRINGNDAANTLHGLDGADTLVGGGGADRMEGGRGDDVYEVDQIGDIVVEARGAGTDSVRTSVSWTLGDHVETLVLRGAAALNGTGNALANTLTGNDGDNRLAGGAGHDVMTGGSGRDSFVFDTLLDTLRNVDTIMDFAADIDSVALSASIFATLDAGLLDNAAFGIGANATTADQRILYDADTGALFYDADGSGAGAKIRFATLTPDLDLTARDFIIF